jgi:DNA polymerase III epsilon subunit-like protein
MTYLAFVDTETTGLHPNRRPWEVAIIRRDLSGVAPEASIVIQVSDVDLSDADPQALSIGRFYERHGVVTRGSQLLTESQAARVVEQWTRGAYLVGAVPSFDAGTLDPMLRRHRLVPAWLHRLRCVETLASGHLGREVGGLKDAAKALDLSVDQAVLHTAMGDARLAAAIWDAVMGGAV